MAVAKPPLPSTLSNDEVMSEILKFLAKIPPAKVEVPAPSDVMVPADRVKPVEDAKPPVDTPPAKVEVAVVVAVKCEATTSPTTDNFAYGEVVPMPRLPALFKRIVSRKPAG